MCVLPTTAGMPYPQNLQTALEVEEVVRQHGATPATIAIIAGQPCIGEGTSTSVSQPKCGASSCRLLWGMELTVSGSGFGVFDTSGNSSGTECRELLLGPTPAASPPVLDCCNPNRACRQHPTFQAGTAGGATHPHHPTHARLCHRRCAPAHTGCDRQQLEHIARKSLSVRKVSRRDMPLVVGSGLDGATTVSGTMLLAARAGIKVFVTGGIGGVHR